MSYERYRHVFATYILFRVAINNMIINNIECITFRVFICADTPHVFKIKG